MIKSCREIAEEIESLRKDLKRIKKRKRPSVDSSEMKKCESISPNVVCSDCNCWKNAREYCS